jgi:hypothetical protein
MCAPTAETFSVNMDSTDLRKLSAERVSAIGKGATATWTTSIRSCAMYDQDRNLRHVSSCSVPKTMTYRQ